MIPEEEYTAEVIPEPTELPTQEEPLLEAPEVTSHLAEISEPIPEPVILETQPEPTPLVESQAVFQEDSAAANYYSTAPYQRREFSEIVSSVKGNFTFLQDSHIDDNSPHMDPAVVAAQPMGTSLTPQPEPSNTLSFQSTSYLNEDSLSQRPAAPATKTTQDVHKTQPATQSTLPVHTQVSHEAAVCASSRGLFPCRSLHNITLNRPTWKVDPGFWIDTKYEDLH